MLRMSYSWNITRRKATHFAPKSIYPVHQSPDVPFWGFESWQGYESYLVDRNTGWYWDTSGDKCVFRTFSKWSLESEWLLFVSLTFCLSCSSHLYGIPIELWDGNWIIRDDRDASIDAIIADFSPLICCFDQNTVCTYSLALNIALWFLCRILSPQIF